jgi:2-polyprenyl-3-methyl-5-hydroxy-6-metoxy-1,4-benzoquinol methylase
VSAPNLAPASRDWHRHVGDNPEVQRFQDAWRESLLLPGYTDPLESALAELSSYFHVDVAEARRRCERWEQDSIEEWEQKDRSTDEGLLEFYRTTQSWIYDTVWYHAKQCSGEQFPESVAIAYALRQLQPGHMLDFGAGPGSTAMYFHHLGWQVSLGDISTTMQDFAKWRLEQHGVPATFYELTQQELPAGAFDLITAVDVVAHIRDWRYQLARIHHALREGGLFVFNIDARTSAPENQWHLYQHHYPMLRPMAWSGFVRSGRIEFFYVYRKDSARGDLRRAMDVGADLIRYNRLVSLSGEYFRRLRG